jgi:lipopolysaccharide export system permease protein
VFSLFISAVAFLFNNNIIPVINLKLNKLKYEIVYTKPAFDIKPGVFYDRIEGFIIKLGSKEKNGNGIKDIVIYERGNYLQDNLILADSGIMSVSDDKRFLEFDLKKGTRYEESGMRNTTTTELTRVQFQSYKKIFDLSSFFRVQSSDSMFKDNYRMLSMRQLEKYNDSMKKMVKTAQLQSLKAAAAYFNFISLNDSGKIGYHKKPAGKSLTSIKQLIPDSAYASALDMAWSKINSARADMEYMTNAYYEKNREITRFDMEWQRKIALSFACFVLFMIGAPLGSIIRKGGLGAPLVFGIIFFVIFHLLNTFGEKLAKESVISPFMGMWLASIIMMPVGIFLTFKALNDSQLFNQEFYFRVFKRLKRQKAKK